MACLQISERHSASSVVRQGVVRRGVVLGGVVLCSVRTVGTVRNVGAVVIADVVAIPLSTSSCSKDEWYHGHLRVKTSDYSESER